VRWLTVDDPGGRSISELSYFPNSLEFSASSRIVEAAFSIGGLISAGIVSERTDGSGHRRIIDHVIKGGGVV
jgi:hypothetical protein